MSLDGKYDLEKAGKNGKGTLWSHGVGICGKFWATRYSAPYGNHRIPRTVIGCFLHSLHSQRGSHKARPNVSTTTGLDRSSAKARVS